jgi:hypothetical protein
MRGREGIVRVLRSRGCKEEIQMVERVEALSPEFKRERFVQRNDFLRRDLDVLVPRALSGVRPSRRSSIVHLERELDFTLVILTVAYRSDFSELTRVEEIE